MVLVDDHPVVRSGIRNLLDKVVDIETVGEAEDGEQALRVVKDTNPDVLLLDMELPDIQGTQVAQRIQTLYPHIKILVLSAHDDSFYVRELLELGVAGYLMKEETPELIVEAVRGIAHGEQGWVSRKIAAQMASWVQVGSQEKMDLTKREHEVLQGIVEGNTNQTIALKMNISEKTVEKYIRAIFNKLDVSSRVEAAVYAVKEGLV